MATKSLSPEMTSYARLCLAINDVCTNSFRDVLLRNVPSQDIKQAIVARWGHQYNSPKFDKYPYSVLFPNHQLDPNFTVSDCDLSLLYFLIRNVSTVPQPSLGWGKSLMNNPQDTSIGANVERLHELRNTVIHLQEPRLSNQEFNSYWNKLRDCVTVIDTYLGGTTYQQKLDCLKTDDMDPDYANRLTESFRTNLQDLQARQLALDQTLSDIREVLNQGFHDTKAAYDRTIEGLSEVKDLIKDENRQLPKIAKDVKKTKNIVKVIHKLMEGKGLPPEIRRMDKVSQNLFHEALKAGKKKVNNIRVMVVGHLGVGKTTVIKRILGEEVEEAPHVSTEGIEVHHRCARIDLNTKEWIVEGTEQRFPDTSQHIVNIVTEHVAQKIKTSVDGDNQAKKKKHTEQDLKDSIQQEGIGSCSTGGVVKASFKPNIHENNILLDRREGSDWRDFVTQCGTMTHSEKNVCDVTMLDFAGQFDFYSTHQAFMSWRTLYLLVTDMSRGLDDVVKDDKCSMSLNRNVERSIKDYAVFWLNSIYSHGITAEASPQCEGSTQEETGNQEQDHRGEAKCPPVILVATHSDKVPGGENEETKEEYFEGVRKILQGRPLRYLLKGYFAFNNFGPETDIDALKQKIVELAEQQEYWGEEIPGRWLTLEQKLMELKRNGEKIIEYSRVEEINNRRDVKIENPAELEVFLRFEHDLGNIVFFPTRKLREKVVLDPEWLMDGVKSLISPPRHLREDPDIYPHVNTFKETGRLAKSIIGSIWSGREHEDFHRNQDHLLDLLEKLSILAKSVEQDGSVEEEYYWVPCVIYKSPPDHVKNPKLYEGMTKTSTLCFESTTKFVHVGVFHRLVASSLSKWPPAQEVEGGKYHLYHSCCEFEVDQWHNLLLAQNDYVILATMFRYSSGGEYPDNERCNMVKEFISSTLKDITTCICPNSKFDIKVKCEKSTDTIKGLHSSSDKTEKRCTCSSPRHTVNVADLMMFWEVRPGQSEMVSEDSEYNNQDKRELHRTVLNHCLPQLIKRLDIESVLLSIQQKEHFDDVTLRDISEQKTTSEKIKELIQRVKQGGPKAYEMFKECLVQTEQTNLLEQLEYQEAEFQSLGNSC